LLNESILPDNRTAAMPAILIDFIRAGKKVKPFRRCWIKIVYDGGILIIGKLKFVLKFHSV